MHYASAENGQGASCVTKIRDSGARVESDARNLVIFADSCAIPASSVLAYRSTLRALATGLACSRRKSQGF